MQHCRGVSTRQFYHSRVLRNSGKTSSRGPAIKLPQWPWPQWCLSSSTENVSVGLRRSSKYSLHHPASWSQQHSTCTRIASSQKSVSMASPNSSHTHACALAITWAVNKVKFDFLWKFDFLFLTECRGWWDHVNCWPHAAVGDVVSQPCPGFLHTTG